MRCCCLTSTTPCARSTKLPAPPLPTTSSASSSALSALESNQTQSIATRSSPLRAREDPRLGLHQSNQGHSTSEWPMPRRFRQEADDAAVSIVERNRESRILQVVFH